MFFIENNTNSLNIAALCAVQKHSLFLVHIAQETFFLKKGLKCL